MNSGQRYVLCMRYADGAIMYVCGPDPALAHASGDVREATVFSSPGEALVFRGRLRHQEGTFATQYTVHEWGPGEHVFPG